MTADFDIIIVGSGPAGVSAAFPLVEAGLKVLMVDGGNTPTVSIPQNSFLTERFENQNQWEWSLGADFHALQNMDAVSPKLRVPTHAYVFKDFLCKNHIQTDNFVAVGSLATGGLSNTWGCGVAKPLDAELSLFPFSVSQIQDSYRTIVQRIGVSGACEDDLSDYFGLDQWAQPPVQMDELHENLFHHYQVKRKNLKPCGFQIGRSRIAVLTESLPPRNACEQYGNCLYGCERDALYSSAYDIKLLARNDNFFMKCGLVVEEISKTETSLSIIGQKDGKYQKITARKIVLAAGTLASTRLALLALKHEVSVPLQSCPIAAFLLWLPQKMGIPRMDGFGYGQLSYLMHVQKEIYAYGSTFSTTGILRSEFVRYLPVAKRYGIDLLKLLLSSCVVGNLFLPGYLSIANAKLTATSDLMIQGGYSDNTKNLMSIAAKKLRRAYWQLNAIILPMSFTVGLPGGDIHYAGTLPMRSSPKKGETDSQGELAEFKDVHIVDGACLPTLFAKPHTLTIMANSDRIARIIAKEMKTGFC